MKVCKRCKGEFEFVEYVQHRCYSVKEWKKLNKWTGIFDIESRNEFNVHEMLIAEHQIILTDHQNKRFVGLMCPTPLKEKIKAGLRNLPGKIMQVDIDKSLNKVSKGIGEFSKMTDSLHGIGGKQTDVSKLLMQPKKTKKARKGKKGRKSKEETDIFWSTPGMAFSQKKMSFSGKGLKLR